MLVPFLLPEVCRRQVTRLKKDRENKASVEGKDELSKEMRSDEFNLERIFVSTSTNGLALDNKYELACTSRRIFLFTLLLSSRASELRLPTAERLVEQARSAAAREQINRKCLPRNLSPRQFRRQKGDDVFLCDECSSWELRSYIRQCYVGNLNLSTATCTTASHLLHPTYKALHPN